MVGQWAAIREATPQIPTNADILVSHFAPYVLPILDQFRDKPHVVHFHGPWALESQFEGDGSLNVFLKRTIEKRVYAGAKKFIALSRAYAQYLERDYSVDPSKISVIPGGVDFKQFSSVPSRSEARDALGLPQNRRIVVTARRLVQTKGVGTLLEAIAEVRRRLDDVYLVIAGTGTHAERLQRLSEDLNISDHVRFLGFVGEKLPLVYRSGNVVVVPSVAFEGFGLIVLEALATGTPVLVTPLAGLEEAIAPLEPALVSEGIGSGQIADLIERALLGKIGLPSSEACRAYASGFDWSRIAARVADEYACAV